MRKKKWAGATPIDLPDGWIEGLTTCGLGVAVHEDYGYVVNLYTGEFITPKLSKSTGNMQIYVPVNMGTHPRLSSNLVLPHGRVVRLVLDYGEIIPKEFSSYPKLWIYHRNGDKRDNTPDNLTWATPRMAMQDLLEMGNLHTKLSPEQVMSIRQAARAMRGTKEGLNCEALGKAFGIAAGYVKSLMQQISDPEGGKGLVWKHWNFVGMPDDDWEPPAPVVDKINGACKETYLYDELQAAFHKGKTVYDY